MADASAKEIKDTDHDLSINKYKEQNVAWGNSLLILINGNWWLVILRNSII